MLCGIHWWNRLFNQNSTGWTSEVAKDCSSIKICCSRTETWNKSSNSLQQCICLTKSSNFIPSKTRKATEIFKHLFNSIIEAGHSVLSVWNATILLSIMIGFRFLWSIWFLLSLHLLWYYNNYFLLCYFTNPILHFDISWRS